MCSKNSEASFQTYFVDRAPRAGVPFSQPPSARCGAGARFASALGRPVRRHTRQAWAPATCTARACCLVPRSSKTKCSLLSSTVSIADQLALILVTRCLLASRVYSGESFTLLLPLKPCYHLYLSSVVAYFRRPSGPTSQISTSEIALVRSRVVSVL